MMKIIELSVVVIYLIALIILGRVTQKRISQSQAGVEEYYVAGRNVGTGVNSLAMMAALGSGGSFMAGTGTAFNLGLPFLAWMTVGSIVGFSVASVLVAKPLRNSRKFTVSEFLNDRYGHIFFKVAIPIVIIIGSAMYLMSQMTAGGLIASYVTGLSYQWGLLIITVVFILYVSMGGMLAVTWTNILQGIMMVALISIITLGGIFHFPIRWSEFFANTFAEQPMLGAVGGTMPITAYLGAFVTWAAAICVTPHLIMRIFTSSNARSAKLSMNISMLMYGSLMLASTFVLVPFVPLLDSSLLEATHSDMWLLLIVEQFFPAILVGVITAGIMAAVMSTTDALLLAVSSAFAYDLYKGVYKPKATHQQILRASAIFTWVIGITVMFITLHPPPFLVVLYTAAVGFMVAALFAPLVFGIWWRQANSAGAITGLSVGAVSFMVAFLGFELPYNSEILIALPLSIISMMIVSVWTQGPSQNMLDRMDHYHQDI
ncbi:SSS family transporter [Geomicrobium halophilum]|uniref:SSS family transporter n=1 Tax=Geomicrobium halophilum TaxID=549000 RepID=A0A841PUZ1_9BACL|nr:sodium:solute symporter family protein [Geomicrobium halophilum]MBB6450121.1 SSS family transporter [Geomicrobium halophilum]